MTTSKLFRYVAVATSLCATTMVAGCGYARDSRSPSRLVIDELQGASGANPGSLGNTLLSDVISLLTSPAPCSDFTPCTTFWNDVGAVALRVQLRDIGSITAPTTVSSLNAVTITRYHVSYRRADGRNTPGVDVPYAFDSALTFTVPADGSAATGGFDLVRNVAKREAPLAALATGETFITMIADVTFYGRDLAGNDVSVTGSIGITFGNFVDED